MWSCTLNENSLGMKVIYTDGACSKKGQGGWGFAVVSTDFPEGYSTYGYGHEQNTTNQRMEMSAAVQALRSVKGDVKIVSDSRYVVDCFNAKWHVKWLKNGWRNSTGKPVMNRDLWELLFLLVNGRMVEWEWVRGHNGDPMNEIVDKLAVKAKEEGIARGKAAN